MEGGGEGMVAVIKGLRDAGLAVTLLNGETGSPRATLYAPKSNYLASSPCPLTYNEGTSRKVPVTTDIGAQVCDDRYTSSYQLAHCNQRPSSPPVHFPEFPLRKPDARRNRSNFGVGFERYNIREQTPSSFRSAGVGTANRSSFTFPDRGIPAFDLRASEAFADSLRKYPHLTRTPSTELICKLLSYTHNKNNANTKTSHPIPKEPKLDTRRYKDKDIQTYTRARPKTKESVIEEKTKSYKRMRIHSPETRDKRYKDSQNETYDYLKATSPHYYNRAAEVRYLSDVSKSIRDTIRQIVEETTPEVCSQMQNRYLQHRKRCQSRFSKQMGESSHENAQTSVAADQSLVTILPYEKTEECSPTCPINAPPCCYCKLSKRDSKKEFEQRVAEKIGAWLSEIPTYANMCPANYQKRIDMVENLVNTLAALKDDEDIEEKARLEVEKCVDKLPMWLPSTKAERDDFKSLVADNLMNKLERVFEETDILDDEISKWIDSIRFRSRNSLGEIVDKDKIADTFADRIKALVVDRPEKDDDYHDALKGEVIDTLHELPIETKGNKDREIERLANNLVNRIKYIPASEIKPKRGKIDKFTKKIIKWLEAIELKRKDSQGNAVNKEKIINNVTDRLKYIAFDRPSDDEEYYESLKKEAVDILEDLPIQIDGSKTKIFDKLASKLAKTLKPILAHEIKPITDKLDDTISQWMKDIKLKEQSSDGQLIDKQEIANTFAERLKPLLMDRPEDNEDHVEALRNEMVDILEDLPIELKGDKTKFIDKEADKLTKAIKDIPATEIKQKKDKFENKISQWMKDITFKKRDSQGDVVNKEKLADDLVEKLKSVALARPEDDEEYTDALKNEIVDILEESPIVIDGNKDKFVDKMATKLAKTLKDIPSSEIKQKKDKFDEKISQWIKAVKLKKKDEQGEKVVKEQVVDRFADRLKSLALERPDDEDDYHEALKEEAVDILGETPIHVDGNKEKAVEKLATKLAKTLKDIPTHEINLKKETDKFDQKISLWMKDIKFKRKDSQGEPVNKDKIADKFAERLKKLALARPDDDDDYQEALKNEVVEILEDLPLEVDGNKNKVVDKLATKLAKVLKDIPASEIKQKKEMDKFDTKISQWMKDIKFMKRDSQGVKVVREQIADRFAETLKSIALERPEDDDEYHELLKNEAVDILEELPIEVDGNKKKAVEKLATKLATVLKDIPTSEIKQKKETDKFDTKIFQWIKDVKFKKKDSQGENVDKDKIADTFADRLKPLAVERPKDDADYHEVLKNEAVDILNELPIETVGNKSKEINKLADKLAKTLKNIPASEIKSKEESKDLDDFENKISRWIESVRLKKKDSQGDKVVKEKVIDTVAERLKPLAKERPKDDADYHEVLKRETVEILNELPIDIKGDKGKVIEKLADKLANTLKTIPADDGKITAKSDGRRKSTIVYETDKEPFSEEIYDWLDDIPALSSGTQSEKNQMVDSLAKVVNQFKSKHMDDIEGLENEIKSWLTAEFQKKGMRVDARTLENLSNQLASNIYNSEQEGTMKISGVKPNKKNKGRSGSDYKEDCTKEIQGWLDDIPGFPINEEEKNKMIEDLAKKLEDLRAEGLIDDDDIQDEITDWLYTESEKRGINLDAKTKDELVNQLAGKIASLKPPRRSSDEVQDEMSIAIWNRLKEFPEIEESEQNRNMVAQFARRMTVIGNEFGDKVSDGSIHTEVSNWVGEFVGNSGLGDEHRDILAKDLTSRMKTILKPNAKQKEIKNTITNEVTSIIDSSALKFSPKAKKNVGRRVSTFLARHIRHVSSPDNESIKKNIVRIIDQETDLNDVEARDLAELFIGSAKRISVAQWPGALKSESPEKIRQVINEKIKNAICTLNVSNLGEIEKQLTDILVDQALNGVDAEVTRERIMDLLQSSNLSKEDAKDLTMRLALQALDFSSIPEQSESALPTEFTINEKEMFQTSAVKEIIEFMDEVVGEMDPKTKRKINTAAQKLAERLANTISDPNQTKEDKEVTISTEVYKFLKRFSVPTQEFGPQLANRLRGIAVTSTPRSSMDYSFLPRRSGFSIGSIYIPDELKTKIEQNFISDLEATIEDWILDLPVHIDDKALIDNIARDLAGDISDRQKYLQSNTDVQPTEEEELEFLKYQIFRAMGKSVKPEELATVMNQAAYLQSEIKSVLIPMLSKPKTAPSQGDVMNKLVDEVSMWVDEISSNIDEEELDAQRQEKVKDLAEKIKEITENKEKISEKIEKIDNEVTDWLKPFTKDIEQSDVKSMANSLKNRLSIKGLIKDTAGTTPEHSSASAGLFQQNTSEFLEENLSTAILDWLKSLPLHQRRTSAEKRIQEDIVPDIAKDIKKVIANAKSNTDIDMHVLKEIKKHLENFPMEPDLKSDKAYIEKVAAQLVDHLNNMQLYQNISARQSTNPVEYLITTINEWIKSLSMNTKSYNTKEVDDMKMEFISHIHEELNDLTKQNDQLIKDDIKQFLEKLPIDIHKASDPIYINEKVEQLFKNILGTPFMSRPPRPTINRDLVESAVQNWSEKLPYSSGKTHQNVSDQIQHFASDISSILQDANASAVDNYRNNLLDETMNFLKQLPLQSNKSTPEKLKSLANDLLTIIKDKTAELSPKSTSKNTADMLYDIVMTWCEDLPLPEGNTPEEKERTNTIKQNLASKLMNKIGELNMNPEILNDDLLYEHLLLEEIHDLLNELTPSQKMQENLESIKENLVSKVKEVKQIIQDEIAGQIYKQQLRDTISKTLPFDTSLLSEECPCQNPESFELLVDNLADAYVDLHFIMDDEEQKATYKNKIFDEITKYCNGYLQRHPEPPLDSTKINQDLYNALKSVLDPKEKILRTEAEHVRMKDKINDWMKKLLLSKGTGPKQVQKNKMATVLAKKLLEIENNPDIEFEEKAQKDISKMLKQLPVAPGHEGEIHDIVQNLIRQLQSTERSRRISVSTTIHSIDLGESGVESLLCDCRRKIQKEKPICCKHYEIPKSTLSSEDRAHLEVIRARNQPGCKVQICTCKDASVNPLPTDAESQTVISPSVPCTNVCTRSRVSPRVTPRSSEQEVSPQVIIKEYLWDSGTSKLLGPVYRLPRTEVDMNNSSMSCLQRPLQKSVCIQPSPCSVPQRTYVPQEMTPPRPCINVDRSPCSSQREIRRPCSQQPSSSRPCIDSVSITDRPPCSTSTPKPCISLGTSPCYSPHQIPPPRPCSNNAPKPCINLGSSPCYSPHQIHTPRLHSHAPKPCISIGTTPCCSPHQISTPRPCSNVPRAVIPSVPSPICTHRSRNTSEEIPYCLTPRRPVTRDQNVPFRQPCFQPHYSRTSSPSGEGPSRVMRPRIINIGSSDKTKSPCQKRRDQEERLAEHDCNVRRRIYRVPGRDCSRERQEERMRCCKCKNRIRNMCHLCPSSENVKHCGKCCGMPCPHPTRLFFR